jgi:chemotaxis signal transduction protein
MTGAAQAPARNSFVLLQVGERRFAVKAEIVAELAPPVRLHNFPHATQLIVGVIVRRGRIVPVYDVGPVLLGRSSPSHRFYLIARRRFGNATEASAIPVTGECELASGEAHPPEMGRQRYIAGTLPIGSEDVDVLDLEALLTAGPLQPGFARPEVQS